jgi:site-specific DNA-methyltransferase (adenine-specific)
MVTPSRWFSGGMGLDAFRSEMLKERRLKALVDFIQEKDAFPNVNINGGVNYFIWEREYEGDCTVTTVGAGGNIGEPKSRPLDEFDIFIRQNDAVDILRKVLNGGHESFSKRISPIDPFKLPTTFHGVEKMSQKKDIKLYGSGKVSFVSRDEVNANEQWIDKWKVLIPQASDGNENYPLPIWNQTGPFIARPGEACTFTYLVASLAKSKSEATYIVDYMRTKFFRFMVSLRKGTQHNKADNFKFVPDLPMDRTWDDTTLYGYFKLTKKNIEFIEAMIREMKFTNE